MHRSSPGEGQGRRLLPRKRHRVIRGDVRGVFGSLFCDFGPSFDVLDVDGEEPHTCIIASISNDATPLVTCVDDERVELQSRGFSSPR